MRATLHDGAPNTYYGQWPTLTPRETRPNRGSIAHRETAGSAEFRFRSCLDAKNPIKADDCAPTIFFSAKRKRASRRSYGPRASCALMIAGWKLAVQ